jgi:tripartite-type tricarboxylate transporter receptor subunit TctC
MLRMVAGAIVALLASAPALAQSVEEFYKANRITIMLGQPPGGSYDLYARLVANHMAKYIPGHPTIIVEHRPGGGGVRATQFFYAQSRAMVPSWVTSPKPSPIRRCCSRTSANGMSGRCRISARSRP